MELKKEIGIVCMECIISKNAINFKSCLKFIAFFFIVSSCDHFHDRVIALCNTHQLVKLTILVNDMRKLLK